MKGTLYVIAAASGAGKTSLVTRLVKEIDGVRISVSHTTRTKRPGEVDGESYHFVTPDAFKQMVADEAFLEHAQVFDHCYGTSKEWVTSQLAEGIDVILEIDWQGALQITSLISCVTIFILPPSVDELERRLRGRGQDSDEVITRRMRDAIVDMARFDTFNYLVINDVFDDALHELLTIVKAQRLLTSRRRHAHTNLIQKLLN